MIKTKKLGEIAEVKKVMGVQRDKKVIAPKNSILLTILSDSKLNNCGELELLAEDTEVKMNKAIINVKDIEGITMTNNKLYNQLLKIDFSKMVREGTVLNTISMARLKELEIEV